MRSPILLSRSDNKGFAEVAQDNDRKFREVDRIMRVQSDSDVVCAAEKRLIVQSANGHYWHIQVDNTGLLATTDLGTEFPS